MVHEQCLRVCGWRLGRQPQNPGTEISEEPPPKVLTIPELFRVLKRLRKSMRLWHQERGAHDLFTVKANQPTLLEDLTIVLAQRGEPDFREAPTLDHGRIETRALWTTTALNSYLAFPRVGQAFAIERQVTVKKTGKETQELVYGLTRHHPDSVDASQALALNHNHWSIDACHHFLD